MAIQTYCTKAHYSVKCAGNHSTSKCRKSKYSPLTYVLCNDPHPANYEGCTVYKGLQRTMLNTTAPSRQQVGTTIHVHGYQPEHENLTYSQTVKANTQQGELTNVNRTVTDFLDRFENMFNQLMNQNSTFIDLLTTLIKNLIKIYHKKISMDNIVRIALWNINGLAHHKQEIEFLLNIKKIDMLLISEAHPTSRDYFSIYK